MPRHGARNFKTPCISGARPVSDFRINLMQSHEAPWAMAHGYAAKRPVLNFLPHLYLDALLAVQPERVTVLQ